MVHFRSLLYVITPGPRLRRLRVPLSQEPIEEGVYGMVGVGVDGEKRLEKL